MITDRDGNPPLLLLQGQSAGVMKSADGGKVLVFSDPESSISFGVPMTDEQMNDIYQAWTEKAVIIAGADQMPITRQNGHGQLN